MAEKKPEQEMFVITRTPEEQAKLEKRYRQMQVLEKLGTKFNVRWVFGTDLDGETCVVFMERPPNLPSHSTKTEKHKESEDDQTSSDEQVDQAEEKSKE